MIKMLRRVSHRFGSFRRDEDGNPTIEFCLMLPVFMLLFTMAFEFGIWQTRQVMLDHGLDQTVRQVRVGNLPLPTHETLIKSVCNYAGLISDCDNQLRLQMFVVDVDDIQSQILGSDFECRDRTETTTAPLTEFVNTGENNQLMMLRTCALFDPFLPTFGVGARIAAEDGFYAVVSTSGYVMEPFLE